MPVAAIEAVDLDVGYEHGLLVDRLALELQAGRFLPHAGSTVASDQEVSSHCFTGRKRGVHSMLLLCESYERLAEFDLAAERPQTLAQDCLRARLRYHQKVRIRHALCRQLECSERACSQRE